MLGADGPINASWTNLQLTEVSRKAPITSVRFGDLDCHTNTEVDASVIFACVSPYCSTAYYIVLVQNILIRQTLGLCNACWCLIFLLVLGSYFSPFCGVLKVASGTLKLGTAWCITLDLRSLESTLMKSLSLKPRALPAIWLIELYQNNQDRFSGAFKGLKCAELIARILIVQDSVLELALVHFVSNQFTFLA